MKFNDINPLLRISIWMLAGMFGYLIAWWFGKRRK
jgi:hypothetical protein